MENLNFFVDDDILMFQKYVSNLFQILFKIHNTITLEML